MELQIEYESSQPSLQLPRIPVKVPPISICFWIIKVLCTTVGKTAADFLNSTLHFGLNGTEVVMGSLLFVALSCQLMLKTYVPFCYWLVVVLSSIVGSLIIEDLTDNLKVPLFVSALGLSLALLATFVIWYVVEKTLSVNSIDSFRKESFSWLAILLTFALGTAFGDLAAETLNLDYLLSAAGFLTLISIVTFTHLVLKLNPIVCFWLTYVLTCPLGAMFGDYLSQSPRGGSLGLGTTVTTTIFLAVITILVIYQTVQKETATRLQ